VDPSKLAKSAFDTPLVPVYPHYLDGGLEVSPDTGRAILFGQDEYHEGLPVYGGCKYMIQTSVMYELVAPSSCEGSSSSCRSGATLQASSPSVAFPGAKSMETTAIAETDENENGDWEQK
jgi:hypothetical protein